MEKSMIAKFILLVLAASVILPLESGERLPAPPRERRIPRGALIWRAFSQLNEAERKKIQELQRTDPEKFHAAMQELAEKFEKQENAWRRKMFSLIGQYRRSTDSAEREKIKNEITRMETERFKRRLDGLAKTIARSKRRVAMMERELQKRKERSSAIVGARVEAILSGEIPFDPPGKGFRKGPRGPHIPPKMK